MATSEETKPANLAAAVCRVMAAVTHVDKTGENAFHRYKYASESDLLFALQPAMAANGLALLPVGADFERVPGPETGRGKAQWVTQGTMSYLLCHESGEEVKLQVPCSGIDGEDKGAYKAATGALKYALRQAFLIPTGDDPDADRKRQANDVPSEVIEAAQKKAADAARSWVISQLYAKAAEGFHAPSFSKELKAADLPKYEDLKHFCLWAGMPKPSTMTDEVRAKLVARLKTPAGRAKFDEFVTECGL